MADPVMVEDAPEVVDADVQGTQFPAQWREDFEGLAYLGKLTDSVEFAGHIFRVGTLTVGEKLQVSLVCRQWEGTLGYNRAWYAAVAAAGIISIDGRPLAVAEKGKSVIAQRFDLIVNQWYDPVIEAIYEKINELERRVIEILVEMGFYPAERLGVILPDEEEELPTE